jgi:arylsulfatase A
MRRFLLGLALLALGVAPSVAAVRRPNIVILFADDQGYGDLGCFGSPDIETPNIDRMAREGVRFTDFYVAQAVCSASRAALLTGCYPNRVGIQGALGPHSKVGLSQAEPTLAERLKPAGYATAIFGKWHLGDAPEFLPTHRGFDEYYGLPYSNDMWPKHPTGGSGYPPLPLIEGDRLIEVMPDQTRLTTDYTAHAVRFIEAHRNQPFFLYVPYAMPHVPLHVSPKFAGKSRRGLYGDVIMEIDWSVGEILGALARCGLDHDTLVVYTSDNGPWLLYGDHGGGAGPLREGKGTCFEGGLREPCVMRWPGRIPAGTVCDKVAATIDIVPTVARLAGVRLDPARPVDGRDILPLMTGRRGAASPHEAYFYYWDRELHAVRSGPWKLHFPHPYPKPAPVGGGGRPGKYETLRTSLELYNLSVDIGERTNVAAAHPQVVARLTKLADAERAELGDTLTGAVGRGVRPVGHVAGDPWAQK